MDKHLGERTLLVAATVVAPSAPSAGCCSVFASSTAAQRHLCTEQAGVLGGLNWGWLLGSLLWAGTSISPWGLGSLPVGGMQGPPRSKSLPGIQHGLLCLQNHSVPFGKDHGPLPTYWNETAFQFPTDAGGAYWLLCSLLITLKHAGCQLSFLSRPAVSTFQEILPRSPWDWCLPCVGSGRRPTSSCSAP